MKELIAIKNHAALVQAVCGRELHARLEIKQDFSNWIKSQIERARLVEGVDFVRFAEKSEGNNATLIQYAITIDSAKNIGMMCGTEKGFEVRAYFIECEKQLISQQRLPQTFAEALRLLADETEAKEMALLTIEHQKETIAIKDDLILVSNEASIKAGEILVREFVKAQDIVEIGEKQFYQWMREQKIISESNEPYQKYVTSGYFTYKPTEERHGGKFRYTLRITPRGKVWLAAKYMTYLDSVAFD